MLYVRCYVWLATTFFFNRTGQKFFFSLPTNFLEICGLFISLPIFNKILNLWKSSCGQLMKIIQTFQRCCFGSLEAHDMK